MRHDRKTKIGTKHVPVKRRLQDWGIYSIYIMCINAYVKAYLICQRQWIVIQKQNKKLKIQDVFRMEKCISFLASAFVLFTACKLWTLYPQTGEDWKNILGEISCTTSPYLLSLVGQSSPTSPYKYPLWESVRNHRILSYYIESWSEHLQTDVKFSQFTGWRLLS